jgi:hypothetical protein
MGRLVTVRRVNVAPLSYFAADPSAPFVACPDQALKHPVFILAPGCTDTTLTAQPAQSESHQRTLRHIFESESRGRNLTFVVGDYRYDNW